MALVLNDRVRETTSVVGTGAVTLLGAVTGFQSFSTIGNSNTTYYCISDQAGVNWEVGIGTYTSAGTTLARTTVLASSNAGSLVSFTAGTKDVFVTYPSEKGVWYDASGNVLFTGTTTAANLEYTGTLTGGTGILDIGLGQLYKDASGNVGIGVTDFSSTGANAKFAISLGGINLDDAKVLSWGGSSARPYITASKSSAYLAMGVSGTERMRIDASGNVGIGTSSPTVKFQVGTYLNSGAAGTALISGANVAVTNTAGMFTVASTDSIAADIGGSIGFTANGTIAGYPTGSIAGRRENATASNYASYMQFSTCNSVGTVVEKMRIDSSGNVGIGTSSPSQKLHVAGSQLLSSPGSSVYTYFDGTSNSIGRKSTGELAITVAGGYPITFVNSTTEAMRIDSSGIALIGTTSASGTNKLQVSSDALINGINVGLGGGASTVNTALGLNALANNSATGYYNTAIGSNSLVNNVLGQNSTSTGFASLQANTTAVATFGAITGGSGYTDGSYTNIQLTYVSGSTAATYPVVNITVAGGVVTACTLVVAANGTSGGSRFKDITTVMSCANTVIGGGSGSGFAISPATLVSGGGNSGFGAQALNVNTTGSNNCAMGIYALVGNTVGSTNTAVGNQVMFTNQTGSNNSAFGGSALRQNVSGSSNSAFGVSALFNVTGSTNTGIGTQAGSSITTGSNNVVIGGYTGAAAPISATGSNYVVLSDGAGNIRTYYDASGNQVNYGVQATSAAASTIASATTIAPTKAITFISGVTPIATITAPSPISLGGGQITLIPTGIFTTTTAGNIALASTAVVSRALIMTYDVTTAKWYPSY